MDRLFPFENGAQVITCGKCGAKDSVGRNGRKAGKQLPPEAVQRFFAARGWRIGQAARKDRCPDCLKPKPHAKEKPPMARPVDVVVPPKPGASEKPPREMQREDRRLIFAKLEEVYVDEKVGYSAGWNDERVAKDMAVPRAWVEEIRDENFGPQKAEQSAEVIELRGKIDSLEKDAHALEQQAARLSRTAAETKATADDAARVAAAMVARADGLRADLRKLTGVRT